MDTLSALNEVQIPGYELMGEIGRGAMSVVYRATRGDRAYALKVMKAGGSRELSAALRFRREAAALGRLNHFGLVQVIEAGESEGQPYLVMELVEGESLAERISAGPMRESLVVDIGLTLAGALAEVHRHGMVHRDVKPANIVLQPSGTPKIIDFGLAAAATEQRAERQEVVGTFLYTAPEQTGLLKRPVDGRSDLYSLGVVLYECLAGRPPFASETVSELLHMHASVVPLPIRELVPDLSEAISAVITKLLSKDPDDRYQSGAGLKSDLESIAELEAARVRGEQIVLGANDGLVQSAYEVAFVGRGEQRAVLRQLWQQTETGSGNVVLVEGEEGSGKSRLCREQIKEVEARGGMVLQGRCDRVEQVPFGPLREALDDYVQNVLRLPEDRKRSALLELRQASGDVAPLLRGFSRGLDHVLEDVAAAPDAGKEPFFNAVAQLFLQLAAEAGVGVLWIDNLHWLDESSFEVLTRMARRLRSTPLLLILSAREEREDGGPRARLEAEIDDVLTERLTLPPLNGTHVSELVAGHLGGHRLPDEFIERLTAVTNGNPFAVGEYVRAMVDAGLVRPAAGTWVVDLERFGDLTLPHDAQQLVLNRLTRLSPEASRVLRVASVIGSSFDVEVLRRAVGDGQESIADAIAEGAREGLLELDDDGQVTIVNERIREALLQALSTTERRDAHAAVARSLDQLGHNRDDDLFTLARHFAAGRTTRNSRRGYEVGLLAGQRSLDNFSHQEAIEHLEQAAQSAADLELTEAERITLEEALGRAYGGVNRREEAKEHFETALSMVTEPLARARFHIHLGRLFHEHKSDIAAQECWNAFAAAGKPFPRSPTVRLISAIAVWIAFWIRSSLKLGYGKAQGEERRQRETLAEIYLLAVIIAFFDGRTGLGIQMLGRQLLNGHYLGDSRALVDALAYYTVIVGVILRRSGPVRRIARNAIEVSERIGDMSALALSKLRLAIGTFWSGDSKRGDKLFQEALPLVLKWLPPRDYTQATSVMGVCRLLSGHSRGMAELVYPSIRQVDHDKFKLGSVTSRSNTMSHLAILGRMPAAERLHREAQRDLEGVQAIDYSTRTYNIGHQVIFFLELDELGAPLEEAIATFESYKLPPSRIPNHNKFVYMGIAYARMRQYLRAPEEKRDEARARLELALETMAKASKASNNMCHWHAIHAALEIGHGHFRRARRDLARAETLAHAAGSQWALWEVALQRARVARAQGDVAEEQSHSWSAFELAKQHGWANRARMVKTEFALEERRGGKTKKSAGKYSTTDSKAGSSIDSGGEDITAGRQLDALLQVSLASASTLDPNAQASAALDEIVKVLGAERAFIFYAAEEDQALTLSAGRDNMKRDLLDATDYSSTVVNKVRDTRKPIVLTGTEEGEILGSSSAVAFNLRSILAAPLMMRDRLLGVVYLDSRLAKGMFKKEDVEILLAIANHIAIAVETARTAKLEIERQALELERKALDKDMALTAAVQSIFLPRQPLFSVDGVALSGFYRPAQQCGGDWWWHEGGDGEPLNVLVGDVTGHGAASAMVTAAAATCYRVIDRYEDARDISRVLERMNTELLPVCGTKFRMTMSALELSSDRRSLRWWNAGAPPIFIRRAGGKLEALCVTGTPLGSKEFFLGKLEAELNPGDRIFVFSDGLSELELPTGRQLGMKKLSKIFADCGDPDLATTASKIVQALDEARQETAQKDDLTFVVLDVLEPGRG